MKNKLGSLLLTLFLFGCDTPKQAPASGPVTKAARAGAEIGKELIAPGKEDSFRAFGPYGIATIIILLAGAAVAYWQKNLRLLYIGILMALIPPTYYLFAPMLALPLLITGCSVMALGLLFAGYWVWDYIKDDLEADRERREHNASLSD